MPEQLMRLAALKDGHPEIDAGPLGNGMWHATLTLEDGGSRTLARTDLGKLLDDVDDILRGGDPRARPG